MKRLRVGACFLAPAVLLFPTQAGAAKPQATRARQTAKPISNLALDGSRVAYASGGKIHVWDTASGKASTVKGSYANRLNRANVATQLAIAGKRVAWIKDQQFGNTEEGEKLYTATVGGKAHLVDHVYRHGVDDPTLTTGRWIEGLAGSGKTIVVSKWKSHGTVATEQQLDLVNRGGLSSLSGGPDAIVSAAVDGGLIAVLRTGPWSASNSVGIYSHTEDAELGEVDLGPPAPETTGIQISLSGSELVVLTTALHPSDGSTTATLDVYDWETHQLLNTWSVGIHKYGGEASFAVQGQLAAVAGPSALHLVNLTTGKDVVIAQASHSGSPPAIDSRGLVYALNPHYNGPGKLVFVPTAKLLALAG